MDGVVEAQAESRAASVRASGARGLGAVPGGGGAGVSRGIGADGGGGLGHCAAAVVG